MTRRCGFVLAACPPVVVAVVFHPAGCIAPESPPDAVANAVRVEGGEESACVVVPRFATGMSLDEVSDVLVPPVRFEFRAREAGTTVLCVSGRAHAESEAFYFLFNNHAEERLARIVQPPVEQWDFVPPEPRSASERWTWKRRDLRTPHERLAMVLVMPALSEADLERTVRAQALRRRHSVELRRDYVEPSSLLAIFPKERDTDADALRAAERFDPFRVRLGTTPAEVDALYGPPLRIVERSHSSDAAPSVRSRVYGPHDDPSDWGGGSDHLWLSVEFVDERAAIVFGGGFFDAGLLNPR